MRFETAAGSIAGAAHVRAGRNSQDAFAVLAEGDRIAAVVTDGCGSAPHSEVGAKLGARIAARALLDGSHQSIFPKLVSIARQTSCAMQDYFLFTVVAALVDPEETKIFAAGDGLYAVNGQPHILGPYPGNAPPYIAYGDVPLGLVHRCPTPDVESLLIASDGAAKIAAELDHFWTDDLLFRNPDAVRRRLFVRRKALDDDTTIVVIRRCAG